MPARRIRESLKTLTAEGLVDHQPNVGYAVARLTATELAEDDPHTYHRQSRHFHFGLIRPSGMLRLVHMLESAWNITEPVQLMVHVHRSDRAAPHADHGQMLEAFLARDADALLAVSADHHRILNAVVSTLPPDTGLITRD